MKNKIILALSLILTSLLANAQQELKLIEEDTVKLEVQKYGNISIVELRDSYLLSHPKNKNLYKVEYIEQKNCKHYYNDLKDTIFYIFKNNKMFGVMDSFGNEVLPLKQVNKPQYDCSKRKWFFVKDESISRKQKIEIFSPNLPQEEEIYSVMNKELKKYKSYYDFHNGTYWVSNGLYIDSNGGGLIDENKRWIIPMSDNYWYVDFKDKNLMGLIPTKKLQKENIYARSKVVNVATGKVVFEDTLVDEELNFYNNRLVFKKYNQKRDRINFHIYDLETQKTLLESTSRIGFTYEDFVLVGKTDNWGTNLKWGLVSLKTQKIILPMIYNQVFFVDSNLVMTRMYKNNRHIFGVHQVLKTDK
jgi:hypothetical protein